MRYFTCFTYSKTRYFASFKLLECDILQVLGIPKCVILQISTFTVQGFGRFDFFVYFCTIYLNIYEIQNKERD